MIPPKNELHNSTCLTQLLPDIDTAMNSTPHPYMCGSAMGMVFCPTDYTVNSNTGFSLLFTSWVISDNNSYYLACFGVALLGACRQALVALRREILSANSGRSIGRGDDKFNLLGADVLSASSGEGVASTGSKRRNGPFFFETKFLRTQPTILLAVDTILFACALGAAYITMLVAMA